MKYTAEQNEVVSKVVLGNAPGNNQMTSPKIQKDIVHCFAEELIKSIIEEIDHDVFGIYWLMSRLMFQIKNKWQ